MLAHGLARLACKSCRDEVLVPFSCKTRGVCPSCNARRAQDTAIHLTERVLPQAPYRQWTLSVPMEVRLLLARDARLLSEVLGLFVRALFTLQRRTARRLGIGRPLVGAVAFVQRFGSTLQLTPHLHVLLPDVVFEEVPGSGTRLRLCGLPPPSDEEVESLAATVARRVLEPLRNGGAVEEHEVPSDEAQDLLWLEAVQPRRRRTSSSRRWPSFAVSPRSSRPRSPTSSATSASLLPMPEYALASSLRLRLSPTRPAPHPARSHPSRRPPDRPAAPSPASRCPRCSVSRALASRTRK